MTLENPKAFIVTLPEKPGIYRMLGAEEEVLYVGKARNLKNRVRSYFRSSGLSPRIANMVGKTMHVEITVTHTESEALLLENNLIKSLKPRYNILLRDDKSYPYIYLSHDDYPRLGFHRGARRGKGRYFGPYPSTTAVRETLSLLQKIFGVRQCENTFYRNRSRPCLQYQIKRCSGPCVGRVSPGRYQEDVRQTVAFLEGRSLLIIEDVIAQMEAASEDLDFETAARCRDRVAALKRVQERQYVSGAGGDVDVLAVVEGVKGFCINASFIRGGRHLGSKSFFPKAVAGVSQADVMSAFLAQYYISKPIPARILMNADIEDGALLQAAFSQQAERKVSLRRPQRGDAMRWLGMAELNAQDALRRRQLQQENLRQQFESLRSALGLEVLPERIECFDISHTAGEATVGSCVVFDPTGPVKSDYRRFNIENVVPGDDYAAMEQALMRRYKRVQQGEGKLPDMLLIDGGKGQLHRAESVLEELQVKEVVLLGVAKGAARKPGLEQLFLSGREQAFMLPSDSPALHLIQQVRDEAHRFAITGHRQRRGKRRITSSLEQIPGVGDKRRQALLKHLGGMQEVVRAGVEDLRRVPGISTDLARKIYDVFH
ncbi:MAG: excinuclease ABC subunit UvrC [Gammaproteobacteria bacterium]|nr:MAG: excinuclease ABC subunit UvrC [Gammaproteobacteria bacterium]